jgi:hypothetical protein
VSIDVRPTPTEEELVAIVAAIEATRPVAVVLPEKPVAPPAWRFSGRWWRLPIAVRRERPWA